MLSFILDPRSGPWVLLNLFCFYLMCISALPVYMSSLYVEARREYHPLELELQKL